MHFKNLIIFVGAALVCQILLSMEKIPETDFETSAQEHNKKAAIEKLNKDIERYNRLINRHPSNGNAHYLKAKAFLELSALKEDNSLLYQALEFFNGSIMHEPYSAKYLIDRARLNLKLGYKDLALEDLEKAKSIKVTDDVQGMYVSNCVREVEKIIRNSMHQQKNSEFTKIAKESNNEDAIKDLEREISLYNLSIEDNPDFRRRAFFSSIGLL